MSTPLRSTAMLIGASLIVFSARTGVAAPAETDRDLQGPTSAQSPCSLLTKEDAATALGEAVGAPKALSDLPAGQGATVSSCAYSSSGGNQVQLNVTRLPASSVPMYRAMCEQKGNDGLAGLGDVACWYNEKHEELHAIKGSTFLSVELRKAGDPTAAIKDVMKKALGRLR